MSIKVFSGYSGGSVAGSALSFRSQDGEPWWAEVIVGEALLRLWRCEFGTYSRSTFRDDVLGSNFK